MFLKGCILHQGVFFDKNQRINKKKTEKSEENFSTVSNQRMMANDVNENKA